MRDRGKDWMDAAGAGRYVRPADRQALILSPFPHILTADLVRVSLQGRQMSPKEWRLTKHQPSRAKSGYQVSCCFVSLNEILDWTC